MSKEIKCVVWDLDCTIWDGVLLESGTVTLKPGIYEIICELDRRGILQSVASKNNYEDAIAKLREFGIEEYFLYPEIHWNSKSSSIEKIRKNLNIGIDTFAFIDDQPFELEEVQSVHNDILCIHVNEYKALLDLPRLQPKRITEDSRRRRLMYLENLKRTKDEEEYEGPKEEFLASLGMNFVISEAREEDLQRAEELTVRTNQLNSTGITYDYDELNYYRNHPDYLLLVCELSDKYGSYGKIGLTLLKRTEEADCLKLLLMSCRVMSRGVGTILLTYLMERTKQAGKRFLAEFRQTDRNRMMFVTYRLAGFKETSNENGILILEHNLENINPYPHYINIQFPETPTDVDRGEVEICNKQL
ncbi:HAD-IIIC family phosphatase [Bacillus cereus ATCC 10876]|uniref:HAD-IIIC family phosphatase n=1 Tax=Bacillus TaxID=1386 RepID=UPI0002D72D7D|nr:MULTISPECIES: HAD-IIIC family phosphatase [Bacillus]MDJ0281892.1 HAD-IIIC family phosphatase [Bacillus bombysepticus]KFL63212.1 HAD phosphatase, family IIIC domain protein [Bacillus cereus ATCC 10876]MBO1130596.1 HAD-IIIC family phosphatase [Bacillus cereus]MDJ0295833.1 HAD-IIIC family phosphatase [Bacillus bombysepticus]MDJ0301645.1 HAD-IIIC family phosphatase [Bacillus bombysepticus]